MSFSTVCGVCGSVRYSLGASETYECTSTLHHTYTNKGKYNFNDYYYICLALCIWQVQYIPKNTATCVCMVWYTHDTPHTHTMCSMQFLKWPGNS